MTSADVFGNYIGGRWQAAESGQTRVDVNPADVSDVVGEFPESEPADVGEAVDAAVAAAAAWRRLGPIARAGHLQRAASILRERAGAIATIITREQGKRLSEARGEVERSLAILDFTVGEGRRLNGSTTPAEEQRTLAYTFRVPLGVVGLISPWNFPLAIPLWKVAPALLAGCTAVLKPSPLTPLTAACLVEVFHDAGVPPGVLNLVQGDLAAGRALVDHHDVAGISFTGSLEVGRSIQQAVAPRLVRTQLELGGKNALVVLDDADVERAVDAVVLGAFGQAGQRCSATSRLVVDVAVKDEVMERLTRRVAGLRVGPGDDERTSVGPVVNDVRMQVCLTAIERAIAQGATVAARSSATVGRLAQGYYVAPTVLSGVAPDSEIAQEEIFGPVLSVIDADGFEDAIEISNSVRYGMSATVFTRDITRMFDAVDQFEAGMLHVNRPGVGAYAHLPHMGTKLSQYGAPECSPHVWDFYTEWRSACVSY